MRRCRDRSVVAILAAFLLVGACTGDDGEAPDEPSTDGDTETGTAGNGEPIDGDGAPAAAGPSGRLALSGWVQTLDGGLTVSLRGIEVDDVGHLFVELEAVTARSDVALAQFSTFLVDDLGTRYDLAPPADDAQVSVPVDMRATARLGFVGPVDPDATRVTFAINGLNDDVRDASDNTSQGSTGQALSFRDLPLPGVGLEHEAATAPPEGALTEMGTVEVGVTEIHELGIEVTVTRIDADARTVTVHLEAFNGSDREVRLASSNPRLTSDDDGRFVFLRPETDSNPERYIDIESGGEATAALAFRGGIGQDATSLSLMLNRPTRDSENLPAFVFEDLPIPGRDATDP